MPMPSLRFMKKTMLKGHGDDQYLYKDIRLNFSSNVFPHFDHEGLFCHLAGRLDDVVSYPEPTPFSLESELAMLLDLTPEELCVTSGATEAIYLIAQTFRRSKTAILQPTFSEYADACRLHEHQISFVYDIDHLPERAQTVWLCCPNNPTGSVWNKDQLLNCIASHQEQIFILDASYAAFTLAPLITPREAAALPNVLMLHSMTKDFSIPGLRLGYITGSENLLHRVRLQRMPWSVNQVALAAGHYLLMHKDEYEIDLTALMAERERMAQALTALGCIEVLPSDTHILLCKLRFGKASALKDYLARERGILIRDASNFEGLDECFFRIAVQTEAEDDELLKGIIDWLSE